MGDNFLEEQAKYARRRRARERSQTEQGIFFNRPDVVDRSYTVTPSSSESLAKDEFVVAIKTDDPTKLTVLRKNRVAGSITGDGARSLISAMEDGMTAVALRITAVGSLSGVAQAKVTNGES